MKSITCSAKSGSIKRKKQAGKKKPGQVVFHV